MNETITKILRYVNENNLFSGKSHVLCAVSGGADSMALLHILYTNMSLFGLTNVSAFHLNHNVRGLEADHDEQYVKEFCLNHSIPFYSYKLSLEESYNANEEILRELRYQYLEICCESIGADCIATGHTLSDQAETIILNLGRGAGLKGLSGIPPKRENIVRPLLCVNRNETEKYCTEEEIEYRIDSSNNEDIYKRNSVRHHMIPELEVLFGNIEEKLNNIAIASEEADSYIRGISHKVLEKCKTSMTSINTLQLSREEKILQKYVLMLFLSDNSIPYDNEDINNLVNLIDRTGRIQLKKGFIAQHYNKQISIYSNTDKLNITAHLANLGNNYFSDKKSINICLVNLSSFKKRYENYSLFELIDYDKIIGNLIIRQWMPGDVFNSLRRKNTKSLKKIFNEKKLLPNDKYEQVILSDDSGIVWLEDEGVSTLKAVNDNTQKVLVIRIKTEEKDD